MTGGSSPKLATLDNPYFFRVRPSDTINGQVAARYAVDTLGAKKIGISYNNNDFGTGDIHWGMCPDANKPWGKERAQAIKDTFRTSGYGTGQKGA